MNISVKRKEYIRYSVIGQIIVWLLLWAVNFSFEISLVSVWEASLLSLNFVVMVAAIVYFHYFLLLPLLFQKQYFKYAFFTLLVISACIGFYFFIDVILPIDYPVNETLLGAYFYNFFSLLLFVAVSSMFYYVNHWYVSKEKEKTLKAESLQTELNFLKSQINPHFLFNTLNNIYAYAQSGNKNTAPMIEKLSGILRFMVYEGNQDKVALNKEFEAIHSLLDIYRIKNSRQTQISFKTNGNKAYHLVVPLILVNLVENACKHSDAINNPDGFIEIVAGVISEDKLYFSISNTVAKKTASTTLVQGGVGLKNMQKRLDLLYGDQYQFDIEEKEGIYNLTLQIPLERKK